MAEVITVSALNQYVKTLLDANDILFDLALRGEIANAAAGLPPGRGHEGSRAMPCYSL